jgi:hypothetical protein
MGIRVAVIDSGVNASHPHIARVDGGFPDDYLDRLGHGTAVMAAIQEKAPDAECFVVRRARDGHRQPQPGHSEACRTIRAFRPARDPGLGRRDVSRRSAGSDPRRAGSADGARPISSRWLHVLRVRLSSSDARRASGEEPQRSELRGRKHDRIRREELRGASGADLSICCRKTLIATKRLRNDSG